MPKLLLRASGALLTCFFLASCNNDTTEVKPQLKQITEAVYASGYILPEDEYQVYSLAEGYLAKKLVREGSVVEINEPLFIIQGPQQDIRYQNAVSVYEIAKENYGGNSPFLKEAKTALEISRNKLENDSINYFRFKNLWETNATSKMELDRAALAYDLSKNEYEARRQQFEKLKNQLYLELKNAQSQLDITLEDKNNKVIKSNISAMVYQTYKEEGELVRRGEPLALLGKKDNMYLQLSVDELDINKIKVGQQILVKADVYGDKVFNAKVTKIYPMFNRREQSFRVDAAFNDTLPDNYVGLSVEANIIIAQKENALVVPRELLLDKDSIYISQNGNEQKIKLTKGMETLEYVEVLGVDKNTTIIIK